MHTFRTPREIITGAGTLAALGSKARPLGSHALLVTGRRAMHATGILQRALQSLHAAQLAATVFSDVQPEPTVHNVDAGRSLCRSNACDLVIGLGGGSAIDAAKVIAALAPHDGSTADFLAGTLPIQRPALPCIAIPTTAGTGAEATPNAVLTDPAHTLKQSLRSDSMLPAIAILDPELTLSCPPHITAQSGMDALAQALESFLSIHATHLTDALALHAARLLLRSLQRAVHHGQSIAAREDCAYASLMAGIALCNARLGAVHGLAHPLGVRYGIPHGLCCAVLLPHVLRMNRPFAPEKFAILDSLAGRPIEEEVEALLPAIGLPANLRSFPLRPADFPAIAAESMPSGSTKANPKPMTPEDFIRLLKHLSSS